MGRGRPADSDNPCRWNRGGPPLELTVWPAVDEARSKVNFNGLHRLNGATLNITGELADRNGQPWPPSVADLSLSVAGEPTPVQYFEPNGTTLLASFNTSTWPASAPLQLTHKGVPVGMAQVLWAGSDASASEVVSPGQSWCLMARPAARADGEDVSVLVVGLRDAGGSTASTDATLSLSLQGLALIAEATDILDDSYQLLVAAPSMDGPWVSPAQAEVTLDGVPIGLTCSIELLEPLQPSALPDVGQFGAASTLEASHDIIATGLGGPDGTPPAAKALTLMPRRLDGQLVGTGLAVTWSTTLGVIEAAYYQGIGRYGATLRSDETGTATVTATTASGQSWAVDVSVVEGTPASADPGPETSPETTEESAGPEPRPELPADVGSGDAHTDAGSDDAQAPEHLTSDGQVAGCGVGPGTPLNPWLFGVIALLAAWRFRHHH